MKGGKSIDVIASLVAWAFFREKHAPGIAMYLTGDKTEKKTPAQVVKRFLKLHERIAARLGEFVTLRSNADNKRLGEIVAASSKEWTKRAEQKAKGSTKASRTRSSAS